MTHKSTIAAFKAKNGYESATSGIAHKDALYRDIDAARYKMINSVLLNINTF